MNDPKQVARDELWGLEPPVAKSSAARWVWWVAGCGVLMLVAMVTLGLFGLRSVVKLADTKRREKVTRELRTIEEAVRAYAGEHAGRAPSSLEVLTEGDPSHAPYLKPPSGKLWLDPWKRPYRYEPPASPGARPRIFTLGSDDKAGGKNMAADLVNTELYTLP